LDYKAVVTKIKVRPHPNADRLQIGNVCNVDVIVGLDTKDGDLGIYFAPDGQLSTEFAEANNLVGKTDPETGKKTGGYFGKNRRVRAQKFRGVNSYGFWIPINSLDFCHKQNSTWVEGTTLNTVAGVPICNKYLTPATIKSIRGQKGLLRRQNSLFARHFDTEHLKRNINQIPLGSIIYLTEKLHGTSGRTGYVLDEYIYKRKLWTVFCCGLMNFDFRINVPSKRYATITGTRKTILKERTTPGFYGNEEFRGIVEDKLKGLLRKGEIVYYEIVGYTTTGKSIMPSVGIADKAMKKRFGKEMSYTYGCKPSQCEIYVYRITNTNEDGIAIDLSWPMVMERCRELGIKHVPNLRPTTVVGFKVEAMVANVAGSKVEDIYSEEIRPFIYDGDSEKLIKIVDCLVRGPSTIDASHIKEGIVVRVESNKGVKAYKEKSHTFLVLEGIAKDKDDYVDMEESC
jgi:hypothetical protein